MQIAPDLKLCIPLRRAEDDTPLVYGYHTPISREVFEANFAALAATKAAIFGKGLGFTMESGQHIAELQFREEVRKLSAERMDIDRDGKPNDMAATAFMAELKRLTLVLSPSETGWNNVPVDVAINQGVIDAEDWREAESALVFFTCAWSMAPRREKKIKMTAVAGVMKASITSLPLLEYAVFLQQSTQGANS
jgi:hypothetical protein